MWFTLVKTMYKSKWIEDKIKEKSIQKKSRAKISIVWKKKKKYFYCIFVVVVVVYVDMNEKIRFAQKCYVFGLVEWLRNFAIWPKFPLNYFEECLNGSVFGSRTRDIRTIYVLTNGILTWQSKNDFWTCQCRLLASFQRRCIRHKAHLSLSIRRRSLPLLLWEI